MAIDTVQFAMIVAAKVTGKALSAGYPDLLVSRYDIPVNEWVFPIRDRSDEIARHHGWRGPIYDSDAVFAKLGLALHVIDRKVLQGSEEVIDLNQSHDLGEYDLVIDPGTSEHCFNVAQAFLNLAGAVKVGGVMSQALPMSMFNHGYWNVNPLAMLDFYEGNGFVIEKMVIRHTSGIFEPKVEDRRKRLMGVPDGAVNIITARRVEKKLFTWPQQQNP